MQVALDFQGYHTVMVSKGRGGANCLYAFKHDIEPPILKLFSGLGSPSNCSETLKAVPLTARACPSLLNYNQKLIVVSGGYVPGDRNQVLNSVDLYDIDYD